MPPLNISHLFLEGDNTFLVRFYRPCNNAFSSLDIGPIYFVHFDDYEISDEPFLDLPWDYEGDDMRFEEAALRISSYFDHEYPLLSTSLREPGDSSKFVNPYNHEIDYQKPYSSHDGYDWARSAGAILDDPVLAAAPGWATYHTNKYIGNAIYIDHDNGYQSRYYHLSEHDLITKSAAKTWVDGGKQIGKVGFTGNVRPTGSKGAHIHFMVVKDKDGNGSFDDNIPDGILDPFGWQGIGEDPWPAYTFSYNGKDQTGIKSTYLWKKSMKNGSSTITTDGGTYTNSGSNTTFEFPFQAVSHDAIFDSVTRPPVDKPKIDDVIHEKMASIGNTVTATIQDGFDNFITLFTRPFTLKFSFDAQDVARFEKDTLSIYSSSDGELWLKEETSVDIGKGEASAQIDHLTTFALFGEKRDSTAPVTTVDISGTKMGEYFTSPVLLVLNSIDTPVDTSLGVLYTGYSINEDSWAEYKEPVTLSDEGIYTIEYYSEDEDGNIEMAKTLAFEINFTPPTPTPTDALASTKTPTPMPTPISQLTITQTPTMIQTPTDTITPTHTPTALSTQTLKPLATQTSVPTPKTSIPDDQGEVKSVFAAESENDQIADANSNGHSNILRNLFMIVIVLTTAIILIWYRVGKKNHFWD